MLLSSKSMIISVEVTGGLSKWISQTATQFRQERWAWTRLTLLYPAGGQL